ncbi:Alpha/beta hydrolase fold [Trema orientale]|uniref:Alpha/beta hydrolase fold n=1 Tax=Trema orientale TaxID=63057 RepID=A0A2P5B1G2_TREOI|nr:Alpha/beta hydrolase fold [Trema orientale]
MLAKSIIAGGNVVLLNASRYHDIHAVVNVSGRYDLKRGIVELFGEDFMQRLKENGCIEAKDKNGSTGYRVTEESLVNHLNTDMHAACLQIDKEWRVLIIHGSADETIPIEDALEFAKIIPNHILGIVEGADHGYSSHQVEVASIVLEFIKESLEQDNAASG